VLAGGLVAGAGLVWLAQLPDHPAYALHVLAPTLVVAAGTSLTMMPGIVAATAGVAPRNAGVASGLINVCRQLGAALGLAVLVTVASAVTSRSGAHDGAYSANAVVLGYHAALLGVAAASVATALLSLFLTGRQEQGGAARP
jgi:hypothetical protein